MTAPNVQPSIRPIRHKIRELTYKALMMTAGKPGANKADQMIVLDNQIELLEEALKAAKEARAIVEARDFDSYKAQKDAAKAAYKAEKAAEAAAAAAKAADAIPGGLTAQEGQTFEELMTLLQGEGFQNKDDQPPF